MHEASIAIALIEQLEKYENQNNVKIEKAVIEVGSGSGVNINSLSFCLEEIKKQMSIHYDFELNEKPILAECDNCNKRLQLDYPTYQCPACSKTALNILEGMEFNIVELEVEENESKDSSTGS